MKDKYKVVELNFTLDTFKSFVQYKTCVLVYPEEQLYYFRKNNINLKGIVLNFDFGTKTLYDFFRNYPTCEGYENSFVIKSIHTNKKEPNIIIKYYNKIIYCERLKPYNGYTFKYLIDLVKDFIFILKNFYIIEKCIIDEESLFKNYNFKYKLNQNKIQIPNSILQIPNSILQKKNTYIIDKVDYLGRQREKSLSTYIIENTLMTVKNILLYRQFMKYSFYGIELKCPFKNIKEELIHICNVRKEILYKNLYNDNYIDNNVYKKYDDSCFSQSEKDALKKIYQKYDYIYQKFKKYNGYKYRLKGEIIHDVRSKINFENIYKYIELNFNTLINESEDVICDILNIKKYNKWKNDLNEKMNKIKELYLSKAPDDIQQNKIKSNLNVSELISIFTIYFTINKYLIYQNKELFYQNELIKEFNTILYNSIFYINYRNFMF